MVHIKNKSAVCNWCYKEITGEREIWERYDFDRVEIFFYHPKCWKIVKKGTEQKENIFFP